MTAPGWPPEVDGAPSWFPDIEFPSCGVSYAIAAAYLLGCACLGVAVAAAACHLLGKART